MYIFNTTVLPSATELNVEWFEHQFISTIQLPLRPHMRVSPHQTDAEGAHRTILGSLVDVTILSCYSLPTHIGPSRICYNHPSFVWHP